MSVERYPNVLRSQQKFISSGRNTLPSGRDNNMVIIRQRPLMKVQEPLNSNKYEKIINQKLSEKRTEQYLQRDNRGNIRYESQIEKLSKICEQFFHQNQRLKQKIRQKNSTQVDLWVKKVSELEYELMKSHEIIHSRDKTIEQMCGQNKITEPIGHRLLTKNGQDSTKMDHLLIQLQKRENEILKFMHKQSQYIQIYVQKEQLQKQIRNLESVIQNQKRELQEYKRNINNLSMSASVNSGMMNMSRSTYFPIKIQPQQSRLYIVEQKNGEQKVEKEQRGKQQQRIQKIREYNNKLLQHLKMSSKQIDRLNKLLKNKMLELESRNKELQEKCRELLQKDKQIQILNLEVENVKESVRQLEQKSQQRTQNCRKCEFAQQNTLELMNKIRELEQIIQQRSNRLIGLQKISFQLAEQKKSLQTRLNQQVHICWELKQLIVKMEELNKQSQINFITQMNNQKANNYTQKEKNKLIQPIQEEQPNDEPQSPLREKGRLFKFPSEVQKKDQQTQIQEQITSVQINGYREEMKASQDRIKVLNEQIAQMTKFIMKQTAEIVQAKDQVRSLQNQRNNLLKQIEKQNKQKEDLSKRIISIEHKMDQMKEEYQKLLHEVQSSQSQTESIHKNIEELMKQKLNIVGIDRITVAPMKEFIQTHPNSQSMTNMRKNVIKADEYLLGCSKISDNNSQPWGKKSSQ